MVERYEVERIQSLFPVVLKFNNVVNRIACEQLMLDIKALASSKGMSVNAYMQDLVRKDQCGLFDTMQIAEKNRDMISGITGNMHDGYDIIFKDGHSCHCRTKKDVRSCIIEYCNEKGD